MVDLRWGFWGLFFDLGLLLFVGCLFGFCCGVWVGLMGLGCF